MSFIRAKVGYSEFGNEMKRTFSKEDCLPEIGDSFSTGEVVTAIREVYPTANNTIEVYGWRFYEIETVVKEEGEEDEIFKDYITIPCENGYEYKVMNSEGDVVLTETGFDTLEHLYGDIEERVDLWKQHFKIEIYEVIDDSREIYKTWYKTDLLDLICLYEELGLSFEDIDRDLEYDTLTENEAHGESFMWYDEGTVMGVIRLSDDHIFTEDSDLESLGLF